MSTNKLLKASIAAAILYVTVPALFVFIADRLPPNDQPAIESAHTPDPKRSGFVDVQHDATVFTEKAKQFDIRGESLNLERGAVKLFYEWFGGEVGDVVVLLAGAGIGSDMWVINEKAFAPLGPQFSLSIADQIVAKTGHRVLTIDFRGHGRSSFATDSTPTTDVTAALVALDTIAVLKELGITQPVHLVGASYGYIVAAAIAAFEPSQVASITGHGASLGPNSGLDGIQTVLANRLVQKILGANFFASATESAALVKPPGLLSKVFTYGPGLDYFQKVFVSAGHTDLTAALPGIQVPFTTAFAAHDANFFPRSMVEANHAALGTPATKREIVDFENDVNGETCGHMVEFEDVRRFVELVARTCAKT